MPQKERAETSSISVDQHNALLAEAPMAHALSAGRDVDSVSSVLRLVISPHDAQANRSSSNRLRRICGRDDLCLRANAVDFHPEWVDGTGRSRSRNRYGVISAAQRIGLEVVQPLQRKRVKQRRPASCSRPVKLQTRSVGRQRAQFAHKGTTHPPSPQRQASPPRELCCQHWRNAVDRSGGRAVERAQEIAAHRAPG